MEYIIEISRELKKDTAQLTATEDGSKSTLLRINMRCLCGALNFCQCSSVIDTVMETNYSSLIYVSTDLHRVPRGSRPIKTSKFPS